MGNATSVKNASKPSIPDSTPGQTSTFSQPIKPVNTNKPAYSDKPKKPVNVAAIVIGVAVGVVIIAIIVTVIMLTRPVNIVIPTVTTSPPRHFPVSITPISAESATTVPIEIGGVTAIRSILYIQPNKAGIVFSANHVIDNFKTVDLTNSTIASFRNFPTSIGYSAFNTVSGATLDTSTQQMLTFDLNLQTTTLDNEIFLSSVPTSDESKFDPNLYAVSSIVNDIVVVSFVTAPNQQTLNLVGYHANGTVVDGLNASVSVGDYLPILTSTSKSYLAMIAINDLFIYDIFFKTNTTTTVAIGLPGILFSSATPDTGTMIVCSKNTVFLYKRNMSDARPQFVALDFLTFAETLQSCAIDATGTYLALSTLSKTVIIGHIGTLIDSLRQLDVSGLLRNANGPVAIQIDGGNLYIVQCDNHQTSVLLKVAAFT